MSEVENRKKSAGSELEGVSEGQKPIPRSPLSGAPTPQGRPKGVPNKITRTFKKAAEQAFEKGGGVDWLVSMMKGTASDRAAVLQLYGRLIPAQLQGEVNHQVRVELAWLQGRAIAQSDLQSVGHDNKGVKNQDVIDVDVKGVANDCQPEPRERSDDD